MRKILFSFLSVLFGLQKGCFTSCWLWVIMVLDLVKWSSLEQDRALATE
jgi:hypothetical protein